MNKVKFKYLSLFAIVGFAAALLYGLSLVLAATSPPLGTASSFAVLAGSAISDVPTSVITGDVGLSPAAGTFYTGLTSGEVSGTIFAVDVNGPDGLAGNNPGLLTTAKNDLVTAYNNAAGQSPTTTFVAADNQLGGQTLTPGVYAFGGASTANLIGTLTLDGQGNANAVFIFQASSTLVTASSSVVALINGAQACNVFWQVTSSATLGSSSTFVGTIMALTAITLNTSATVTGRALARNSFVELHQNTINVPVCQVATTTTTLQGGTTTTTLQGGTTTTTLQGGTTTTTLQGGTTTTTLPPGSTTTTLPPGSTTTTTQSPGTRIPAVGKWGMVILALAFLGAIAWMVRARRSLR